MKKWQAALRFIGLGWYVAICITLGILGGLWLDRHAFNGATSPLFTIVGLLLGITVAFYGLYRMIRPFIYDNKDNGKDK